MTPAFLISTSRSHGCGQRPTASVDRRCEASEAERVGGRRACWAMARSRGTPGTAICWSVCFGPRSPSGSSRRSSTALGRLTDPKLPDRLLVHDWRSHSPKFAARSSDTLLSRAAWTSALLSVARGRMRAAGRDRPGRGVSSCSSRRGTALRAARRPCFAHQARPRQAVVDAVPCGTRGSKGTRPLALLSSRSCVLHAIAWAMKGSRSGPDLAASADKSPEALLIAILDPNRAFEAKYAGFTVATMDGRVLTGLIANESATAVTLRRQDGKEDVLLRSQIEEMTILGAVADARRARERLEAAATWPT